MKYDLIQQPIRTQPKGTPDSGVNNKADGSSRIPDVPDPTRGHAARNEQVIIMQVAKLFNTFCRTHAGPQPRRVLHGGATMLALMLLSLIWPLQALAQQNQLVGMDFVPLSADRVELMLELSGPAPDPISFTIDSPARIALDLANTANALERRSRRIDQGVAHSINTAEAEGRTRVVVNLNRMVPYATRVEGNRVYVTLNERDDGTTTARREDRETSPQSAQRPRSSDSRKAIDDIDFRRGRQGQGRVMVDLSDPNTEVDISERGGRTIVTFRNTRLPEELMRRFDVIDFATPVQTIDARQVNGNAELTISPEGEFERLAYQADEIFTVEFQEVPEEELERRRIEEREYTGERITLNFQDVDVRAVLQILADVADVNMVISDSVSGSIALRLEQVPWDQALDIILENKGLGKRQVGNVVSVAPMGEIVERQRAAADAREVEEERAPVRQEYVQINYARAADIASLLRSGDTSLLSERGQVTVDERTNTLLVQDTASRLNNVRDLVNRLDIPVRQVLIESRIVLASSDFEHDIGGRFGYTRFDRDGPLVSGNIEGTETIWDSFDPTDPEIEIPGSPGRLNSNFGASAEGGSIAYTILEDNFLVDLELSALQAEGAGEVVSNPRVITANQRTAEISQGVEIPYQEATAAGATSISFQEATLSMEVTPQITPDDRVIMDLVVSKDSIGEIVPTGTGGSVPTIDTQSVTTQVLVNDGETVVLGGIFEQETRETQSKVPVLGDIPVLGRFFRRDTSTNNQAELLIFVTPRILREGLALE